MAFAQVVQSFKKKKKKKGARPTDLRVYSGARYHRRLPPEGFLRGHRPSFWVVHVKTLTRAAGAGNGPPDLPFSERPAQSGSQRARSPCRFSHEKDKREFDCSGLAPLLGTSFWEQVFQA